MKHIGRKIRRSAKRLLKTSRVAGRALGRGTGFVRKIIGTADNFTGGAVTAGIMSNPYSAGAYAGLRSIDQAAQLMSNPQNTARSHLKDRIMN